MLPCENETSHFIFYNALLEYYKLHQGVKYKVHQVH